MTLHSEATTLEAVGPCQLPAAQGRKNFMNHNFQDFFSGWSFVFVVFQFDQMVVSGSPKRWDRWHV